MTEIQKSMIGKRFGNLSVIDYKKINIIYAGVTAEIRKI